MSFTIETEKVFEEGTKSLEKGVTESIPTISVVAVSGGECNKTIKLWASVHCQQVLNFVDSGSSASFLGSHMMGALSGVQ